MSAFEAKIRVGEAGIQLNRENDDELALEAELVLGIVTFAPVGPNQVIPVPFGALRVPLDKAAVEALAKQLNEAAEQMKDRPNIEVANSLAGVEQAAQFQQGLR